MLRQSTTRVNMSSPASSVIDENNFKESRLRFLRRKCYSFLADIDGLYKTDYEGQSASPLIINADLDELDELKVEFSDASVEAIALARAIDPDLVQELEDDRTDFLKLAKDLRNNLLLKLPPASSSSFTAAPALPVQTLKLPKINLQTFNGDFAQWAEFKSLSESLVLQRQDLPQLAKYHFLRTSLSGTALSQMKSLPMEEM